MSELQDSTKQNVSPTEILGLANLADLDNPEALFAAIKALGDTEDTTLPAELEALPDVDKALLGQVVQVLRHHLYEQMMLAEQCAGDKSDQGESEGGRGGSGGGPKINLEALSAQALALEQHQKKVLQTSKKSMGSSFRGYYPGGVSELIESILRPATVDWNELFRNLVARYVDAKRVRGYSRISNQRAAIAKHLTLQGRRQLGSRVPLFPGITKQFCYRVAYIVDTSGSMSSEDLTCAMSELQQLMLKNQGLEVYLIYADAAVQAWQEIRSTDQIDFNMKGRGGTDFDPALQFVVDRAKEGLGVDMVVYATDGYCTAPTVMLDVPTIWLITPGDGKRAVTNAAGNTTIFMKPYLLGEQREAA